MRQIASCGTNGTGAVVSVGKMPTDDCGIWRVSGRFADVVDRDLVGARADENLIQFIGRYEDAAKPDEGRTYVRTAGVEPRPFDDLPIEIEGAIEPVTDLDLLVFASRHTGETRPLLTAHVTGDFGPAEFGCALAQLALVLPALWLTPSTGSRLPCPTATTRP